MGAFEPMARAVQATPHFSFFRRRLERWAGPRGLHEYLIAQANLRGFLGAFTVGEWGEEDPRLAPEEIAVGLLMPHAPAEPRLFKLVFRMIQSGRLDLARLVALARRERAAVPLWWLVSGAPASEISAPVEALRRLLGGPPRGYRELNLKYDFGRLARKPYRRAAAS